MKESKPKVLVIVGPTASGKTSLSIELTKQFNGEVISADSRQVYRGLDIGTGKVTAQEMQDVPHHLLDVADPMDIYTAANFVRDGQTAIADITDRGKVPIVAGGTFFYVDALLGKISTPEVPPNEELRNELETKSTEDLASLLQARDPDRYKTIDTHNRRRLVRALEIVAALGKVPVTESDNPFDTLTLGIKLDTETLHSNIHARLHERIETGMIKEVEQLLAAGVTHERLEDLGLEYRYISRYIRNELSETEMVAELETKIKQFAKRQLTWLKRDESIVWLEPENREAIFQQVETWLGQ